VHINDDAGIFIRDEPNYANPIFLIVTRDRRKRST
jgi:hypothetical protein